MKKLFSFLMFLILLVACTNNNSGFDANKAAMDYCACMSQYGAPNDYWYAKKVCDGKLTERYYYFRIMEVDSKVIEYDSSRQSFFDSVRLYNRAFNNYVKNNCCRTVNNCIEGQERPSDARKGL